MAAATPLQQLGGSSQVKQFEDHFNSMELHDLIIKIQNQTPNGMQETRFPAHKVILAMTSPFFKTQLYSDHWTMNRDLTCS
jgi:hypothetical protein